MTGQQLKNSILQLAIQGKLVPQNPDDEPASVLLERIRTEKEKLTKEGKISKDKNPSVIFRSTDGLFYEKKDNSKPVCIQDEIPFEIPESWKWRRLNEVARIVMGQSPDGASIGEQSEGIEFHQGKVFFGEKYLDVSPFKTDMPTRIAEQGAILLCVRAPVGKVNITKRKICIGRGLCAISSYINTEYLYYFLLCNEMDLVKKATGTTFAAVTKDIVFDMIVPVPPKQEQQRIVDKLFKVLSLVQVYDKTEKTLSDYNKSFPEQLKKSLLQYAMQGKLVPQNPENEPARVLLERIREEKKKLVKDGVIKKDKHESVIYKCDNSYYEKVDGKERCIDDEIPFDIPDSWAWTRLRSIVTKEIKRGKSPIYVNNSSISVFAQKCNLKAGGIDMTLAKYLSEKSFEKYPENEHIRDNDIIINSTGNGTLGRVGIFHETDRINSNVIVPDSHVTVVRILNVLNINFYYNAIKHYQPYLEKNCSGSTNQTELKPDVIAELLVPIPPLHEQNRIVRVLENMLMKSTSLGNNGEVAEA